MIQRALALALAVGFVAAAFLLIPSEPGGAPTGEVGGTPPNNPVAELLAQGGVNPNDPPGVTSKDTSQKCDVLHKRLEAMGGLELSTKVATAAVGKYDETKIAERCAAVSALPDAELKKVLSDELGVVVP
jgi:hypothetical protein